MSNLPLQSRPPKYPLGPKGLFGGMAMPGATGQALHPPIAPTGSAVPGRTPPLNGAPASVPIGVNSHVPPSPSFPQVNQDIHNELVKYGLKKPSDPVEYHNDFPQPHPQMRLPHSSSLIGGHAPVNPAPLQPNPSMGWPGQPGMPTPAPLQPTHPSMQWPGQPGMPTPAPLQPNPSYQWPQPMQVPNFPHADTMLDLKGPQPNPSQVKTNLLDTHRAIPAGVNVAEPISYPLPPLDQSHTPVQPNLPAPAPMPTLGGRMYAPPAVSGAADPTSMYRRQSISQLPGQMPVAWSPSGVAPSQFHGEKLPLQNGLRPDDFTTLPANRKMGRNEASKSDYVGHVDFQDPAEQAWARRLTHSDNSYGAHLFQSDWEPSPSHGGQLPPSPTPVPAPQSAPAQRRIFPTPNGLPVLQDTIPGGNTPMIGRPANSPLAFSGPFAAHAQTPANLWSPEMHQQLNASMSPDTQLSMLNNQVRSENRARDTKRKLGIGGFGGMVDGTEASNAAKAHQKELIDPLIATNRKQNTERWMSPSDAKQLKLGGAKPVEQAPTPSLDETSPFWAGEGKTKQLPGKFGSKEPGTTVVSRTSSIDGKPSRGSELIGAGAMAKLNAAGITAQDLASRKPGDTTDLAFKQLQRESSTTQAKKLSEEGGGVSKARQREIEQRDEKMIRHASQHGHLNLPNVRDAIKRKAERDERKAEQSEIENSSKVGKTANERAVAASEYAKTPAGIKFNNEYRNHPGRGMLGGLQVEKPLMDTLDSNIKNASTPQDIEAIVNMVAHHPDYVEKKMPELTKRLDSLRKANKMSIPGGKKPVLPESPEAPKEEKKPTFGSTLMDALDPPALRQPGKPLYPGRFGGY